MASCKHIRVTEESIASSDFSDRDVVLDGESSYRIAQADLHRHPSPVAWDRCRNGETVCRNAPPSWSSVETGEEVEEEAVKESSVDIPESGTARDACHFRHLF